MLKALEPYTIPLVIIFAMLATIGISIVFLGPNNSIEQAAEQAIIVELPVIK